MKHLLTLLFIAGLNVTAQAEKMPAPSFLVADSAVSTIPHFNEVIAGIVPGYQLVHSDTSKWGNEYTYKFEKANGDRIVIKYMIDDKFGDPDMKIPGKKCIDLIEISAQYITQVAIYNKLYGTNYTPDDFREKAARAFHLFYGVEGIHFNIFPNIPKPGYWQMKFKSYNK